jgi:hypothetical protein
MSRLFLLLCLLGGHTSSSLAGADVSWVPLVGVKGTGVVVVLSDEQLSASRSALENSAKDILGKRGYLREPDLLTGLYVYLDVQECGVDCPDSVVLVVRISYETMVQIPSQADGDPIDYQLSTWSHQSVTIARRAELASRARELVAQGVEKFAATLAKAIEIGQRSG